MESTEDPYNEIPFLDSSASNHDDVPQILRVSERGSVRQPILIRPNRGVRYRQMYHASTGILTRFPFAVCR